MIGYLAIGKEFSRLERNIHTDYLSAALNAATMLEASCKFYLGENHYHQKDTLKALTEKTLKAINCNMLESSGNLIKGLSCLCAAIEIFRNKYSAAHGKSQTEQRNIANIITQAEALLYIQTSNNICQYILSKKLDK
ncbi:abortive infection family protein [Candidatus Tokpelaia sp.]|uniref:abortive infection family protein n=1 Tax=Candidatus Tokpelaia sp. TaxID=2233777 RepID=UPI00123C0FCA|nr:abortive infection family protein [Candidatus Tokpelaia sp.]KAA6405356.1 hypothetical protein DPQ22_04645 [Candidatus Tokpelaia sp.]